jgi:predicted nucleic acid-binding protein
MPVGKTRYYWDSCVFISLLTGIGRTDSEKANLQKVEKLCDDGQIVVFTAAITLVEVLACKMTADQEDTFKALLRRTNVYPVSVTMRIAEIAREIRNHYRMQGDEIAVADSIHLATAIHYKATALHTFDGCGKRSRKTDLLKLTFPLIGKYPLVICKPEPPPPSPEELAAPVSKERDLFADLEAMADAANVVEEEDVDEDAEEDA